MKKEIRASHYLLASLVIAGPCPENSEFLWRTLTQSLSNPANVFSPHPVLIRLPLQNSFSIPQHVPMHKRLITATHLHAKHLYNWKILQRAVNQWQNFCAINIICQGFYLWVSDACHPVWWCRSASSCWWCIMLPYLEKLVSYELPDWWFWISWWADISHKQPITGQTLS